MRLIVLCARDIVYAKVLDAQNPHFVGYADSPKAARELRQTSGDLVFHESSWEICTDTAWLFDWESRDADSYAHRAIRNRARLMTPMQYVAARAAQELKP